MWLPPASTPVGLDSTPSLRPERRFHPSAARVSAPGRTVRPGADEVSAPGVPACGAAEASCDPEVSKGVARAVAPRDRKSTRLNSSHVKISYAVFCLKK